MAESSSLANSKWAMVACAAIFLGGVVELLQKAITDTRMAEFDDFLANAVGAGIVLLGVYGFKKYKYHRAENLEK